VLAGSGVFQKLLEAKGVPDIGSDKATLPSIGGLPGIDPGLAAKSTIPPANISRPATINPYWRQLNFEGGHSGLRPTIDLVSGELSSECFLKISIGDIYKAYAYIVQALCVTASFGPNLVFVLSVAEASIVTHGLVIERPLPYVKN
jgi:hypothetical protein